MKRSPLRRVTPLRAKTPLRSRSRLRAKRDPDRRQRQEAFRQAVVSAAGGKCQAQTPDCPPYPHPSSMVHHILPRSAGGPDEPSNGLAVCRAAHARIHDRPEEAYAAGWLRKRGAMSGG